MTTASKAISLGKHMSGKAAAAAGAAYLAGCEASATTTDTARELAVAQVRFESLKALKGASSDDIAKAFWQRVKSEALAQLIENGMSEADASDVMTRYQHESSLRVTVRQFVPFMRWINAEGGGLAGVGSGTRLATSAAGKLLSNRDKTTAEAVGKALRSKAGIDRKAVESLIGVIGRKPGGNADPTDSGGSDTDTDTDTSSDAPTPTPTPKRSVSEAAEALAAEFSADELQALAKQLQVLALRSAAAEAAA